MLFMNMSPPTATGHVTPGRYETLALRLHPPNTHIDNTYPDRTVLIIDSANRPGTLVEVRGRMPCYCTCVVGSVTVHVLG
jgi:hypothetical protein